MRGPAILLAAALAAVLAAQAGHTADDRYAPLAHPLTVEKVADTDTYYIVGTPAVPDKANQGHTSNAGFTVTAEGVVVFDALGTPSLGAALLEAIRERTDQPVRYVVVSHYHADHIYGLQALTDASDALVVAQRRAGEYLASDDAAQRLEQRREALAPWVDDDTRLVAPDITFTDAMTLELGDKRFRLVHAGPAHAPDDLVMLVKPSGVLFAGDVVQNGRVPFLASSEVDSANWLDALDKVSGLGAEFVIPGHGAPYEDAGKALAFTRNYLEKVRSVMKQAVEDWVPFEQAYDNADWSRYRDLPAFEQSHKRNAYYVYLEMEDSALGGD